VPGSRVSRGSATPLAMLNSLAQTHRRLVAGPSPCTLSADCWAWPHLDCCAFFRLCCVAWFWLQEAVAAFLRDAPAGVVVVSRLDQVGLAGESEGFSAAPRQCSTPSRMHAALPWPPRRGELLRRGPGP
jgi:hypothetical protein